MPKYKRNQWNKALVKSNGKYHYVLIFPYKRGGKILYKYKHLDYQVHGDRKNDSASSTHSDLIRKEFGNIPNDGIDLPKSGTEIKETRQDKYYIRENDKRADQFLFYNHRTQKYKLVKDEDYQKVMGDLNRTHTPTQLQVDKMEGITSSDPKQIKRQLKK